MRTTLTIDEDIAGILRRRSRELDKSLKEVVNDALRRGLVENIEAVQQSVVVRPHDFGSRWGVDMDRLNQLVDELEVGDYSRRAERDSAGC